jgi:hypothetical protein
VVGGAALFADRLAQAATAVRGHLTGYEPPDFADAPGPDAALFLCAIDHSSGYDEPHTIDGEGPYSGSELLWHLGCAAERRAPGALGAHELRDVGAARVEELFRVDGETTSRAEERARLWRDLAAGLLAQYDGSAQRLLDGAGGRLRGAGGLIERLARFEAYSDPVEKKPFLFAKIAARRGWLEVRDPENWEVCPDNVLMRLALRAGLIEPGEAEAVRAATRAALKALAEAAGVTPPVLDDLLWEVGRRDPDLLGTAGGDIDAPPRPPATFFY